MKKRVGVVTAWAECGMGNLAKNWVYTLRKHPAEIDLQIFSRDNPWISPFRWNDSSVVSGPETMDINHPLFWNWIETFKPHAILFQDQNIYSTTAMKEETGRLRRIGIKLINYPDWIMRGDIEKYRGLYDCNLAHVKRNHRWFVDAGLENPVYIPWGVITGTFPFKPRETKGRPKFYINLGTGTLRKGYPVIPRALRAMEGRGLQRLLAPRNYDYSFVATAIETGLKRIDKGFIRHFKKDPRCELLLRTADNSKGGLFSLGDIYVYPTRKEGVGLTITEAMCTGMPVVTTDYPTMNEWITDGCEGRLVRPAKVIPGPMPMNEVIVDADHLAEILIDYIEHPGTIRDQSHCARKAIEQHYNWDDRDEQFLALFR